MKNELNNYPLVGFCERFQEARHQKGYSRDQLAKKVGISRESLRGYEGGWIIPTLTVCAKLATELDVSLDWLCYGKEQK